MSKIRDQVKAFHQKFGVTIRDNPTVPPEDEIVLRMALIFEEYKETMEALGFTSPVLEEHAAEIWAWKPDRSKVNLVKFADGLGDVDYTVEGARQVFGINGEPIADEIHASNMRKHSSKDGNGKITKPIGFVGPDIRSELIKQGMNG